MEPGSYESWYRLARPVQTGSDSDTSTEENLSKILFGQALCVNIVVEAVPFLSATFPSSASVNTHHELSTESQLDNESLQKLPSGTSQSGSPTLQTKDCVESEHSELLGETYSSTAGVLGDSYTIITTPERACADARL